MNIIIVYDLQDSLYKAYELEMIDGKPARRLMASDDGIKQLLERIRYYGIGVKEILIGVNSEW